MDGQGEAPGRSHTAPPLGPERLLTPLSPCAGLPTCACAAMGANFAPGTALSRASSSSRSAASGTDGDALILAHALGWLGGGGTGAGGAGLDRMRDVFWRASRKSSPAKSPPPPCLTQRLPSRPFPPRRRPPHRAPVRRHGVAAAAQHVGYPVGQQVVARGDEPGGGGCRMVARGGGCHRWVLESALRCFLEKCARSPTASRRNRLSRPPPPSPPWGPQLDTSTGSVSASSCGIVTGTPTAAPSPPSHPGPCPPPTHPPTHPPPPPPPTPTSTPAQAA
jgi:hypothetical protein